MEFEKLQGIIESVLNIGPEEITMRTAFVDDLGADSLDIFQIIMGIACEEFADGESLPSVRQLAQVLGVNMHTVNKAYAILREEGYLKLDRRKGAVISVETLEKQQELASIQENLRMLVAEAVCKGVTEDEMNRLIHDMYQKLDRK